MRLRVLTRLSCLLLLLLAGPSRAHAAWSEWVPMGGNTAIVSDLSCVSDNPGTAICAGLGGDHVLNFIGYTNGAWGPWTPMGNPAPSMPSCGSLGGGTDVCATIANTSTAVVLDVAGGSEFSLSPGSFIASAPSCVSLAVGSMVCVAATTTHGLFGFAVTRSPLVAKLITTLPTETVFSPVNCGQDGLGSAVCAWIAATGHVIARKYTAARIPTQAGQWSAELDLAGLAVTPPRCSYSGVPGVVGCYAASSDVSLYGIQYKGGPFVASNWNSWEGIASPVSGGGCAGLGPVAGLPSYVCAVINLADNHAYYTTDVGDGWVDALPLPKPLVNGVATPGEWNGNPTCIPIDTTKMPAQVMCMARTVGFTYLSTIGP